MQVIAGMGGIGKTELATEYIHRNIDKYEIIWWIRAEHHDRVREALVKLAQRLELRQAATDSDRDRTIAAALDRLQSETRPSWLLVYDNAVIPLDLEKYLPLAGRGGISSLPRGSGTGPATLSRTASSVAVHRRRGGQLPASSGCPASRPGTAGNSLPRKKMRAGRARPARLAAELGHLPIAIDHAAAYLAETARSVDEYLTRFAQNAHQLLNEQPGDPDPPAHVSGTWAMSTTLLTADAEHLFNLCAFFSPEPIAAELFLQDTAGIDDPPGLGEFLSSPQRFRAAASQLHRLSLAKVDGARDLIQMHRVVQAVTQGRLRQDRIDMFHAYRAAVDALLASQTPVTRIRAAATPSTTCPFSTLSPITGSCTPITPHCATSSSTRYGGCACAARMSRRCNSGRTLCEVWRERLGEDDLEVLTLAVEVAIAMYMGGRAADAHELILQIRPLLQRYTDGDGFKVFLLCESFYGEVLRAHSQFREALELDLSILPRFEMAFGVDHERTHERAE